MPRVKGQSDCNIDRCPDARTIDIGHYSIEEFNTLACVNLKHCESAINELRSHTHVCAGCVFTNYCEANPYFGDDCEAFHG